MTAHNSPVHRQKETKEGLTSIITNDVMQSVNFGFTLATVLAWNETIKKYIQTFLSEKIGSHYTLVYALSVTILAACVLFLGQRFKNKNASNRYTWN